MNTFIAIYIQSEENYHLLGLYNVNEDEFTTMDQKFQTIRSFIADNARQAVMLYENNGEPIKIYPAFPVEQLDTEYGPFTLAYLHKQMFGTPYNREDWLDYSEL